MNWLGKVEIKSSDSVQVFKNKFMRIGQDLGMSTYKSSHLVAILTDLLEERSQGFVTHSISLGINSSESSLLLAFSTDSPTDLYSRVKKLGKVYDWSVDYSFEKQRKKVFLEIRGLIQVEEISASIFEKIRSILAELTTEESLAKDLENSFLQLKEKSKQLNDAKKAAEIASRTKSLFLANMSHEIRTPLGAILGFSNLLKEKKLNEEQRQNYIHIINRNASQLKVIIDDILDLSKIESGKMLVEQSEFSLSNLLIDIKETMGMKSSAGGIEFYVVSDGLIPEFIISDSTRIRQILINLVGNAMKFTESGHVMVKARYFQNFNRVGVLEFDVEDTGIGMNQDAQEKLFEPFTQADSSTTRRFGGTGLGLTLSLKLAQALGGEVKLLESKPHEGTSFRVSLACQVESTSEFLSLGRDSELKTRMDFEPSRENRLKSAKILIVDDSIENLTLAKVYLRRNGATPSTVTSGLQALDFLSKDKVDLVLMDIQMPGLDGYETTRRLREAGLTTPIIALTANAFKEEKDKALQAGCDAYITKPFQEALLVDTIVKLTSAKSI